MTNNEILDAVMPDNNAIAKSICDIAKVLSLRNTDDFINKVADNIGKDAELENALWELRDAILSGISIA